MTDKTKDDLWSAALEAAASVLQAEIERVNAIFPDWDYRKRKVTLGAVASEYDTIKADILSLKRPEVAA